MTNVRNNHKGGFDWLMYMAFLFAKFIATKSPTRIYDAKFSLRTNVFGIFFVI